MPSKLRKAIGAVKDQTSISLAKVLNTNSSNLEVAVLKATTRDQDPIDERHIEEILQTISSNKVNAAICAHVIARRIRKTKNWVIVLKSLMLVLRIFQDGDPFFPKEVLLATKRGAKILNLSTFRDDSNSSPYDYTAFVRSFAFYLELRLDCFLTGKLQRRFNYKERQGSHPRSNRVNQQAVREMKPPMLLDRISYWQRLLDKAIETRPNGSAQTNRLVQVSLYAVVRESFDLYRDISDGLGLLLDGFFHLQHQSCVHAFQYCVKATKQCEELASFYELCKNLGVGKRSEYPSVQMISDELVDTLRVFLKDQASVESHSKSSSCYNSSAMEAAAAERVCFQTDSRCSSSEDLMCNAKPVGTSLRPSFSADQFPGQCEEKLHDQLDDMYNLTETASNHSLPIDQGRNVTTDLVCFDDWPQLEDDNHAKQNSEMLDSSNGEKVCWELGLMEAPDQTNNWLQQDCKPSQKEAWDGHSYIDQWLQENQNQQPNAAMDSSNCVKEGWELVLAETPAQPAEASILANDLFDQTPTPHQHQYNPFLDDETDISSAAAAAIVSSSNEKSGFPDDLFVEPTFRAPIFLADESPNYQMVRPTFRATNIDTTAAFQDDSNDPFGPWPSDGAVDQQSVLLQQQLWLKNQTKIMAKHMV